MRENKAEKKQKLHWKEASHSPFFPEFIPN